MNLEEPLYSAFIEGIADRDETTHELLVSIQSNPSDSTSWNKLATRLLELEEYDQSAICYDKSLEIDPMSFDSWYNKGIALSNLGKYDEALHSYDRAIKINPDSISAWISKGYDLNRLGRYKEAIRAYERAIEQDLNNTTAWYSKGIALSNLGKYDEAIQSYSKVLEIDDKNTDALNAKGLALERLGKYDEAIQSYNKVLKIDENNTDALNAKGLALQRIGRKGEAADCFNRVTSIYEEKVRFYLDKGGRFLDSSQYKDAIRVYNTVIKIDPNNIIAWYSKGIALSNLGKYDEAIQSYSKVLEIDENNTDALNAKGLALERLGKYDEADQSYNKVLEINPRNVEAWLRKARIKFERHGYAEAIECYNQALTLSPDDIEITTELRQIYSNHTYEYEKALGIALKLNNISQDSRPIMMLAEDYIKTGNYEKGRKQAEKALTVIPRNSVKLRSIVEYLILALYYLESNFIAGDRETKKFFEGYTSLDEGFRIEQEFWDFNGILKVIHNSSISTQKKRVLFDLTNILRGHFDKDTLSRLVGNYAGTSESLQRSNRRLRQVVIPSIIGALAIGVIIGYFGFIEPEISKDDCDRISNERVVPLERSPGTMVLHPNNNEIYVAYDDRSGTGMETLGVLSCTDLDRSSRSLPILEGAEAASIGDDSNIVYSIHPNLREVIISNLKTMESKNITVGRDSKSVAVDLDDKKAYVANFENNTVSVVDMKSDRHITIIEKGIGPKPISVGVDPNKDRVYVANSGGNHVSIINTESDTVIKNIAVGSAPISVAVDSVNHRVYVAYGLNPVTNEVPGLNGWNRIAVIDSEKEVVVDDINVGTESSSTKLPKAISGDVYELSNSLDPLHENISAIAENQYKDIAVDAQHEKVYVANFDTRTISEIDARTNKVIRIIDTPFNPAEIELSSKKGLLFVAPSQFVKIRNFDLFLIRVAPQDSNWIRSNIISPVQDWIVGSTANKPMKLAEGFSWLQVDARPTNIAVGAETNRTYVTNHFSSTVTVIDTRNDTVVDNIPVGKMPHGIVLDSSEEKAFVANSKDNTVSVIDTRTLNVTNISVGSEPTGVAVDSNKDKVYVANSGNNSNTVSVIDTNNNTLLNNITVGKEPYSVAVDSKHDKVYVANYGSNTVYVLNGTNENGPPIGNISIKAPRNILVDSDENTVYVLGDNGVSILNSNTSETELYGNILCGEQVGGIDIDFKNDILFVNPGRESDTVSIMQNPLTGKSKEQLKVECEIIEIGTEIFQDPLEGIDGDIDSNAHIQQICLPPGSDPLGLKFDPRHNRLYVANGMGNSVLIKDVSLGTLEQERIESMSEGSRCQSVN
jgi:YVTN family beta-propeller protein